MVTVPERRNVRTAFILQEQNAAAEADQPPQRRRRLYLENSPLIGGPSWLPLHIKVILRDYDDDDEHDDRASLFEHRWDFVPVNATEFTTLQRLLTLQAVPAEIRYQCAPIPSSSADDKNNSNDNQQLISMENNFESGSRVPPSITAGFDIVIADPQSLQANDSSDGTLKQRRETTERLVQRANEFCREYPEQLHLVQNNCWRFAFELYEHLQLQSADNDDDAAKISKPTSYGKSSA